MQSGVQARREGVRRVRSHPPPPRAPEVHALFFLTNDLKHSGLILYYNSDSLMCRELKNTVEELKKLNAFV